MSARTRICGLAKDSADLFVSDGETFTINDKPVTREAFHARLPELGTLQPCECGCGTLTPHGHLEGAHPEDYKVRRESLAMSARTFTAQDVRQMLYASHLDRCFLQGCHYGTVSTACEYCGRPLTGPRPRGPIGILNSAETIHHPDQDPEAQP